MEDKVNTSMNSSMTTSTSEMAVQTLHEDGWRELSKEDRVIITFTALGTLIICIICGCCIHRIQLLVHRTRQVLPELPEMKEIAKEMRRFSILGSAEDSGFTASTQMEESHRESTEDSAVTRDSGPSRRKSRESRSSKGKEDLREVAFAEEAPATSSSLPVEPPKASAAPPDIPAPSLEPRTAEAGDGDSHVVDISRHPPEAGDGDSHVVDISRHPPEASLTADEVT